MTEKTITIHFRNDEIYDASFAPEITIGDVYEIIVLLAQQCVANADTEDRAIALGACINAVLKGFSLMLKEPQNDKL